MKCIRYILDLLGHEIKFAKIISSCEGTVINSSIGAGAIELAGARAPKFPTAGALGHNRIYGEPVKKSLKD